MKPAEKPIVVRYKKLGRERVLGLADLDENTIIIDPRQPSRTFTGRIRGQGFYTWATPSLIQLRPRR